MKVEDQMDRIKTTKFKQHHQDLWWSQAQWCYCRAVDSAAHMTLQALEHARRVEKQPEGGRKLSSIAQRDLDRIANQTVVKQTAKQTGSPCHSQLKVDCTSNRSL
ncbi:GL15432 [Drosophila persimilis]|uniref:GL15432 n=1 Tax=Drosophila persimilis TaxID=7234 RepID=B4HCC6_DROPE|nr:40S ribosomal protein S19a [Drosophila persimilis]EDW26090.1 GL15432 [Drosophila persimilis]